MEKYSLDKILTAYVMQEVFFHRCLYLFINLQHCPPKCCPLAGNSVHADRQFLQKYMPEFCSYLHYRNVDVSTVKELYRWFLRIALRFKNSLLERSLLTFSTSDVKIL